MHAKNTECRVGRRKQNNKIKDRKSQKKFEALKIYCHLKY